MYYIKNENIIITLFNFKKEAYASLKTKRIVSWSGYSLAGQILSMRTPIALSSQCVMDSRVDGAG